MEAFVNARRARDQVYSLIGITYIRRKYLRIASGDKRDGVWGEDTSLWP